MALRVTKVGANITRVDGNAVRLTKVGANITYFVATRLRITKLGANITRYNTPAAEDPALTGAVGQGFPHA